MPHTGSLASEVLPGLSQGSARSFLLTILGELVMPHGDTVWTSQLLTVMTGLDIEPQTARQAIARAAASGWIVGERHGREVRWTLTAKCTEMLREGERRVRALAEAPPWDGRWVIAFLTIPQSRGAVRRKIYAALERRGFGNPVAGVWMSPHPERREDLSGQLDKYNLADSALVFVGTLADIGMSADEITTRAWRLNDIAALYRHLLERFAQHTPDHGEPTLLAHVRLVNAWQHMPLLDPHLPAQLLPDWPGRDATRVFNELRASTFGETEREWQAITHPNSP
jgi:phenylacetic acid degradation operon negative regulatory protein